ncbi:hypothetical protein SFC42_23390 [Priestia filamentosa]
MWKKAAVQVGFMALDYGLKKRKQKKKASKKRTKTTKKKRG